MLVAALDSDNWLHSERPENIRKVVDGNALTYIVDIIVQHTAFDIRQGVSLIFYSAMLKSIRHLTLRFFCPG